MTTPSAEQKLQTALYQLFVFTLLFTFPLISNAKNVIVFPQPQSSSDASHTYYIDLIKLALDKSNKSDDYTITISKNPLTQGRTFIELAKKNGLINIYQSGTTQARENKFIAIKIPLLKGTLGYRINLIHKDNINKFNNIASLADLSKLSACQGTHWPDSDILEAAGLRVIRNASYENMFLQVKNKHCDYFPRAIIEAYSEEKARQDPDIVVHDKLVISYQFPMYFFISPHQKQLATDIKTGLNIAVEDGSFDDFFQRNNITKPLFPLSKWRQSLILNLDNPFLPNNTPTDDKRLWVSLQP